MREVIGLGQLRYNTSTYLERVAAGATIDVVRRGRLVARIVPVGDRRVAPVPARSIGVAAPDGGGWVGLDELRRRAGRCFDRVAAGETLFVVREGSLLARIVPAGDARTAPVAVDAAPRVELEELRRRGGRYLDRVAAGQPIEVTRGGKLVAHIVAAAPGRRLHAPARRAEFRAMRKGPATGCVVRGRVRATGYRRGVGQNSLLRHIRR